MIDRRRSSPRRAVDPGLLTAHPVSFGIARLHPYWRVTAQYIARVGANAYELSIKTGHAVITNRPDMTPLSNPPEASDDGLGARQRLSGMHRRILAALRRRRWMIKAMSFASIGVVNSIVDFSLFLLALRYLTTSLVAANIMSWCIAVTGSYVMNSFITFAAESGRQLTWRRYATFAASQLLGLVASTSTLVAAALVLPVLFAKLLAIGAAFLVNFSMSHFVVFRNRAPARPE